MGLREDKKRRTRQQILLASAQLFTDRGFEGTRMDDIAEAAGVSRTTLFNYFPSKDEIVLAMAGGFEQQFPERIRANCNDLASTRERLASIFREAAHYFTRHRALNAVIYPELTRIRGGQERTNRQVIDAYRSAFSELLQAGRDQGDVRSDIASDILADMLWSALSTGLYRAFGAHDREQDIEAAFTDYARLMADALAPPREQHANAGVVSTPVTGENSA